MPKRPAPSASPLQNNPSQRSPSRFWLEDVSTVPLAERRLARLALGAHTAHKASSSRGILTQYRDQDELLALLLPLVDRDRIGAWAMENAEYLDDATQELLTRWSGAGDYGIGGDDLDWLMRELLRGQRTLAKRLAAADDRTPISASTRLLVTSLSLTDVDAQLLDYLDHHRTSEPLRMLLRQCQSAPSSLNRQRLATVLGLPPAALAERLSAKAPLRRLGLLEYGAVADLEDFIRPSDLLGQIADAAPETEEALLAQLIEPAPAPEWSLEDFPHLAPQLPHLSEVLTRAARTGLKGINALFYGEPGTGKT